MSLRASKGLRNYMLSGGALKDALQGGKILIYTGAQPTSADDAPTGTLLCTITDSAGSHTAEVRAQGRVTLSGSSGSLDALEVDGLDILGTVVPFTTDLSTTAALAAAIINANPRNQLVKATASGAAITLTMRRGWGALANGLVVEATLTTMTSTDVNIGTTTAGVSSANGLKFEQAAAGVLAKLATQTWSGTAGASGTAGWFRFVGSVADSGAADSAETEVRLDGAIATSGQQLNMSSTTIASGSTQTIASFPVTLPTL